MWIQIEWVCGKFDIIYEKDIIVYDSALEAAKGADAIIVITDWKEFNYLDWKDIFKFMRKPAWVFDSRVFLDKEHLKDIGFNVWTLGS